MKTRELKIDVAESFAVKLHSVCQRIGVDAGQFVEDMVEDRLAAFEEDLQGPGGGEMFDFIADRAWSSLQARKLADLVRTIPGNRFGISVKKCTEFPGQWRVVFRRPTGE